MTNNNSIYFFFFNDTATTEIYTLSLHDALPISIQNISFALRRSPDCVTCRPAGSLKAQRRSRPRKGPREHSTWEIRNVRSEEHTSELQSRQYLVCRLLLEKKKKISKRQHCTSKQ